MLLEQNQMLQNELHKALIEVVKNAKSIGYNPTIFNQMIATEGGYNTAKKLLHSPNTSKGFEKLWELKRLDLSTEAVILKKEFRPLFSKEEIEIAKTRLSEYGYEIEELIDDTPQRLSTTKFTEWVLEIIESLKELGGTGNLEDIYLIIQSRNSVDIEPYVDWKSQVRKQIYLYSSDCDIFKGKPGDETDLFFSIEGKGKGFWGLRNFSPTENNVSLIEDDLSFVEGKRKLRTHLVRERNPKVIKLAKERFKEKHGRLFCEVCDFDFSEKYGELGDDFIEGHHTIPVSELEEGDNTRVEDIALVCSNCHKMLHRRRPWLNKMELKELINR